MARIVIADDEVDLVDILADILRDEGHEVVIALDGAMALASLRETEPDILLLDLDMPEMDGRAVVSEIRKLDGGLAEVPIVLLSGNANVKHVAAELGVAFSIAKPVLIEDLLAVVDAAVEYRPPRRIRAISAP